MQLTQKRETTTGKYPSSLTHQLQWETGITVDMTIRTHATAGIYMHTILQYRRSLSVFAEKTIARSVRGISAQFFLPAHRPPPPAPVSYPTTSEAVSLLFPFRHFHTTPPRDIHTQEVFALISCPPGVSNARKTLTAQLFLRYSITQAMHRRCLVETQPPRQGGTTTTTK